MSATLQEALRGRLLSGAAINRYIQGGNATITIVSRVSGERYTLKFSRPDPLPNRKRPIWVSMLSGPDNESDYVFLGTLWDNDGAYAYSPGKSRLPPDAKPVMLLKWLARLLSFGYDSEQINKQAEVFHEGKCGRCGRKLTVPESIYTGFGPECINYV